MSVVPTLPVIPRNAGGCSSTCCTATKSCGGRHQTLSSRPKTLSSRPKTLSSRLKTFSGVLVSCSSVLDATAADYSQLQEKHAELAETLGAFASPLCLRSPSRTLPRRSGSRSSVRPLHDTAARDRSGRTHHRARHRDARRAAQDGTRPQRRTSLDHLPHNRIEHDLPESEKTCSGCVARAKQRIGEDLFP